MIMLLKTSSKKKILFYLH